MSTIESRELTIADPDGGSSVELSRKDGVVAIERAFFYTNHNDEKSPLVLSDSDRRTLIAFLNMGEYRELTREER